MMMVMKRPPCNSSPLNVKVGVQLFYLESPVEADLISSPLSWPDLLDIRTRLQHLNSLLVDAALPGPKGWPC